MNSELVEEFLSTLFYSWGSDAPAEATWSGNRFLEILEHTYDYKFVNKFSESHNDELPANNYEVVLEEIKQLLKS